jgi:hypothetical protein
MSVDQKITGAADVIALIFVIVLVAQAGTIALLGIALLLFGLFMTALAFLYKNSGAHLIAFAIYILIISVYLTTNPALIVGVVAVSVLPALLWSRT